MTDANRCYCGDYTDLVSSTVQPEHHCNHRCAGDNNQFCGGDSTYTVYATGKKDEFYFPGCIETKYHQTQSPILVLQLAVVLSIPLVTRVPSWEEQLTVLWVRK